MKKYGHHFAWLAVVVPGVGKVAAAKLIAAKIAAKVGAKMALKKVAAKAAAKFLPKFAVKGKAFKVGKAIKTIKATKGKVAKTVNRLRDSKTFNLFKKLKSIHDKIKNNKRNADQDSRNTEDRKFAASVERYAERDEAQDEARDVKILDHDANRLGTSAHPNKAYENLKNDFERLEHTAAPGQFSDKLNSDFRRLQRVTESRRALEKDDARLDRRVRLERSARLRQQRQRQNTRHVTSEVQHTSDRIVVVPIVININQRDLERVMDRDIEQEFEQTRNDVYQNDLEEDDGPQALENTAEEFEDFLISEL